MSNLNADKIDDTLNMADAFCVIESWEQVEEMFHSFHKTQHSLSKFIFCAMFQGFPVINADVWVDYGTWIYMRVVTEEMLSKYDSWMPARDGCCYMRKAFIIGVEEGSERKILDILQRRFAQLCDGDDQNEEYDAHYDDYPEDVDYDDYVGHLKDAGHDEYREDVDYDVEEHFCFPEYREYEGEEFGFADSDDEDEEYDGGNDDYNYDVN